jgi:hypothetical protein
MMQCKNLATSGLPYFASGAIIRSGISLLLGISAPSYSLSAQYRYQSKVIRYLINNDFFFSFNA